MDLVDLDDLTNYYIKSGKFQISDDDQNSIKDLRTKQTITDITSVLWFTGCVIADIKLNATRYNYLKGLNKFGARLPYVMFHVANLITTSMVRKYFSDQYFNSAVDIFTKYDSQAYILKYGDKLIYS